MNKLILLILFLCSNIVAGSFDCYGSYVGAAEKVDKIYKTNQYKHSLAYKDQYVYEIYPTIMYPMFMVEADSIKKLSKYNVMWLCRSTIGINTDNLKEKRIQISVLQYTKTGNIQPAVKTYIMYYLKWDGINKLWEYERPEIKVVIYKQPDGTYRSK